MKDFFDFASRAGDRVRRRPRRRRRAEAAGQAASNRRAEQHDAGKGVLRLLPADAVTEHSIDTPRKGKLAYTATAGTLAFYDQSGDQSAAVFYTAYVAKSAARKPAADLRVQWRAGRGLRLPASRPGRPAHSRSRAGRPRRRARELRDNPDTWLAFTDLVLIDPIGTGWSRTVKPDDAKHFWNVAQRRRFNRQGDCALRRQEQPRRVRRNICSAKAMAASAPPRWRARCNATRASRSPAS